MNDARKLVLENKRYEEFLLGEESHVDMAEGSHSTCKIHETAQKLRKYDVGQAVYQKPDLEADGTIAWAKWTGVVVVAKGFRAVCKLYSIDDTSCIAYEIDWFPTKEQALLAVIVNPPK